MRFSWQEDRERQRQDGPAPVNPHMEERPWTALDSMQSALPRAMTADAVCQCIADHLRLWGQEHWLDPMERAILNALPGPVAPLCATCDGTHLVGDRFGSGDLVPCPECCRSTPGSDLPPCEQFPEE